MPIDPSKVVWDDAPARIEPKLVKWDDVPQKATGSIKDALSAIKSNVSNIPYVPDLSGAVDALHNAGMGAIKGASDIGSTLLSLVPGTMPKAQRDALLKEFFAENASPESMAFKGGDLASDIAGTAGVGGVLAKGARLIPGASSAIPAALESGGLSLGGASLDKVPGGAIRAGSGAVVGGVMSGLVNPDDTGIGAVVGGAIPGAAYVGGKIGTAASTGANAFAEKLMASSLKPTLSQWESGKAANAIKTMLQEGIPASNSGLDTINSRISGLNEDIKSAIANSSKTINQQAVLDKLNDTRRFFGNQVNPAPDINLIDKVAEGFTNHPKIVTHQNYSIPANNVFVDNSGNIVNASEIPSAPKLRSLLAELKNAGGISNKELSDLGIENANKSYPGLFRKDGGMDMDRVVETMEQNGWFVPGQVNSLDSQGVGGSHEFARDMIRGAMDRDVVLHPADYDAYAAYSNAMSDLEKRGLIPVKQPSSFVADPSKTEIPVQLAQDLKQGTHKVLAKKYGQVRDAGTEAEKAIVRGLKEEIAKAVPEVSPLNARESDLLDALSVLKRRAFMNSNNNPLGLGPLTGSKAALASFLADRSMLIKSLAAHGLYRSAPEVPGLLVSPMATPIGRAGLLSISAGQ